MRRVLIIAAAALLTVGQQAPAQDTGPRGRWSPEFKAAAERVDSARAQLQLEIAVLQALRNASAELAGLKGAGTDLGPPSLDPRLCRHKALLSLCQALPATFGRRQED